jgi:Domain of unknown function (DUF4259)
MGTWGSGLLENDSAQDFLDEIAALDQRGRYERISQALNTVQDNPAAVMQQIAPEELIAAVVIVAASVLMEAEYELAEAVNEVRNGRLTRQEAYSLVGVALLALRSIVGDEHGWWMESWVSESDRRHASRQIQEVIAVLDRQATLGANAV